MCSGYGITLDGASSWLYYECCNFGVGNSSSSYTDNRKNNFSVLGEGSSIYIVIIL